MKEITTVNTELSGDRRASLRRRLMAAATGTVMVAGLSAAPAYADSEPPQAIVKIKNTPVEALCKQDYPTPCLNPSHGNDVVMRLKFSKRLPEITELCITTFFGQDQLDPGEEYYLDSIGGAVNGGDESLQSRENCIEPDVTNNYLAGFENVRKVLVHFYMVAGSVSVSGATASVTVPDGK